ncbi:hypothetical protein [Okeania hirsuta]|uniref:hypothetical protein n=1 Tax=Okeania hirsuta TaxID=1458930 RepID=UPI001F017031|nr:hypothetical protein [Okeania hirsuta]
MKFSDRLSDFERSLSILESKLAISADLLLSGIMTELIFTYMNILPNLLRSLLLTSIFSFVTPILLIGVSWTSFALISHFPSLRTIGQFGVAQIWHFLATFGDGHPWQGCLVIAVTFSLVGAMFDTYVFCQNPRGN